MIGYQGCVGLYEILLLMLEFKKLLVVYGDLFDLCEQVYCEGIKLLCIFGVMKVVVGLMMIEEVFKVVLLG